MILLVFGLIFWPKDDKKKTSRGFNMGVAQNFTLSSQETKNVTEDLFQAIH